MIDFFEDMIIMRKMELVLEGEERERDSCEDKWFRQLG